MEKSVGFRVPQGHEHRFFPLFSGHRREPMVKSPRFNLKASVHRFMPITDWLPTYSFKNSAAKDIAGGTTLGCILVAQSLAHANLCKVALINGPYSCILPPIIYSIFGTCVHSSVGTGGLISLLTGVQLSGYGSLEERTHAAAIFTLLVGVVIAMMGICRLAFLVRFLSKPALSGFITASAILIIVSQLKPMLGLPSSVKGDITDILLHHVKDLKLSNGPTIGLSLAAFAYMYYGKTIAKKLASRCHWSLKYLGEFKELITLALTAIFCGRFASEFSIAVVGDVPRGLPHLSMPMTSKADFDLAWELFPGAILVALVTFLSSYAGAKKFAMEDGYHVSALNELLALGFANIGGSLCGAVPTQIGLSRMGIARQAGVTSQLGANVFVALVVAAVVQFFSAYLYYVPSCVLNCIIVNGASHLTEFNTLIYLWDLIRAKPIRATIVDFVVWVTSCLCTLVFGAFAGLMTAVATSLVLILYEVVDPNIHELGWLEEKGRWMSLELFPEAMRRQGILAFRCEGPLFFANFDALQDFLEKAEIEMTNAQETLHAIIFSVSAMPFVDTTAAQSLQKMIMAYRDRDVSFLIANAVGQPMQMLSQILKDVPGDTLSNDYRVEECVRLLEDALDKKLNEPDATKMNPLRSAASLSPKPLKSSANFVKSQSKAFLESPSESLLMSSRSSP